MFNNCLEHLQIDDTLYQQFSKLVMEKMQVEVLGEYSLSVDQYANDEQ